MTRVPRSSTDELTLGSRLQWHASQSLRHGTCCSLLVLQPLGPHQGGHAASAPASTSGEPSRLAAIAARLRTVIRHTDVVEVDEGIGIGILLHDADAPAAQAVSQRVCRALTEHARPRVASRVDDVALRLGVGMATAAPAEGIRQAALARQLVCVASAPDLWITVSLPGAGEHATRTRRRRTAPPRFTAAPIAHRPITRITPRPQHVGPTPGSTSEECEELRRRADALGVPYVCLPAHLPTALSRVLNAELARELSAVPIGRTRGLLTVAMLEPTNLSAMQRLAAATGLAIFPVLASQDELVRLLDQCAGAARPRTPDRESARV